MNQICLLFFDRCKCAKSKRRKKARDEKNNNKLKFKAHPVACDIKSIQHRMNACNNKNRSCQYVYAFTFTHAANRTQTYTCIASKREMEVFFIHLYTHTTEPLKLVYILII